MKYKLKKLWYGKASVRDYIVAAAVQRKEPLELIYGNEMMVIPVYKLDTGKLGSPPIHSKIDKAQQYQLIDFPWKPTNLQPKLL